MKLWAPHVEARALGPPHLRGQVMHQRQLSQTIPCISRTVEGQPGHSLLQASMPDDEELECALSKRKFLNWTPLAFLNSLGHTTGFSTSKAFNKEKVTSRCGYALEHEIKAIAKAALTSLMCAQAVFLYCGLFRASCVSSLIQRSVALHLLNARCADKAPAARSSL